LDCERWLLCSSENYYLIFKKKCQCTY
jgi:hypothetical protein